MHHHLESSTALTPANPRAGFTIQEVLVVTAIIGVLVALIAPAVMWSREAARTTGAKNNMRQILMTGIQHEETANGGRGYQDPQVPGGSAASAGPLSLFETWHASTLPAYKLADNNPGFTMQPDGTHAHWPSARGLQLYDVASDTHHGPWKLMVDPRLPAQTRQSPFGLYVMPNNAFSLTQDVGIGHSNRPVLFTRRVDDGSGNPNRLNPLDPNADECAPVFNDFLPANRAVPISDAVATPGGSNAGFRVNDGVGLVGFADGSVRSVTPAGLNLTMEDIRAGRPPRTVP